MNLEEVCNFFDNISDKEIEEATIKTADKGLHEALLLHKLCHLQQPFMSDNRIDIGWCRIPADKVDILLAEYGCVRISDNPRHWGYKYVALGGRQ